MHSFWINSTTTSTLRILFWFRTLAIGGQIATTILAMALFSFPLNLPGITAVIGVLILVNIYTWFRSTSTEDHRPVEIFIQLLIDIAALTGLFYFAGGATNPFISMYLLPVAIGAVLLSQSWVWILAAISVGVYSYLMLIFPNSHMHHGGGESFNLHVFGMWISFLISAGVIAYFVTKMRTALKVKDDLLNTAREQAIRDEKLVSLGALAASTAHELGTPLGTIQLIVSELEENNISQQDIDVLLGQTQRCKTALSEMSASAGSVQLEGGTLVGVNDYLQNLIAAWEDSRPNIKVSSHLEGGTQANILAEKALSKALINLLDNAADASPDSVEIFANWNAAEVKITVSDQGAGIDPEVLTEIGKKPFSGKPNGIGIGAFLAHEIIRRLGGVVTLSNRPAGGLETAIILPLQAQS